MDNASLNQKLKNLFLEEKRISIEIIQHICEVDRRKLFLEMAYSSLFEYLVEEIGYAPAVAQRRIDAARLMQQIPELKEKLETGAVNLTQISKLQRMVRQAQKTAQISVDQKKHLLNAITHKSPDETDLILAKELSLPIKIGEKKRVQSDGSVRLELTLTKEEMEVLEKAKELLAHTLPHANFADTIYHLAKQLIEKRTKFTSAAEVTKAQIRRRVFARDKVCQYRNPSTGKLCASTRYLQIDHIHPKWAGGNDKIENLRLLCANHNRYRFGRGG